MAIIVPTTNVDPWSRASFWSTNTPLTAMIWFYATTLPTGPTAYKNIIAQADHAGMDLHYNGTNARLSIGTTTNDFDGNTVIAANTWYHGAWVRSGNSHDLYLNGVSDRATGTDSEAVGTTLIIGEYNTIPAAQFIGSLAGAKLWNQALSATEVRREMQQLLPVRWAGILGVYPLLDLSNELYDWSGRGQTLTSAGTHTNAIVVPPVPLVTFPLVDWGTPLGAAAPTAPTGIAAILNQVASGGFIGNTYV